MILFGHSRVSVVSSQASHGSLRGIVDPCLASHQRHVYSTLAMYAPYVVVCHAHILGLDSHYEFSETQLIEEPIRSFKLVVCIPGPFSSASKINYHIYAVRPCNRKYLFTGPIHYGAQVSYLHILYIILSIIEINKLLQRIITQSNRSLYGKRHETAFQKKLDKQLRTLTISAQYINQQLW